MNKLVAGGLVLLTSVLAGCGEAPPDLLLDRTEVRSLSGDDSHTFDLVVDEGQFVTGVVDQISVDTVVTVVGPDESQVGVFDVSARGPENIQFEAELPGAYQVVVTPFESAEGDYAIEAFWQEPMATTPEGRVDQMMRMYGPESPGGVVAVTRGGKIVFDASYGLANIEYGTPNTVSTPWHMASVSKQFTAFAIIMLQQDGQLDIDDDVRKYLPELPDFGATITVRHLLNHTSGLRDHWTLWTMSGGMMDDVIRQEDIFRLVLRQRDLNFQPGEEFLYSNSGYMLASEIVTRVSGQPFGDWMHDNVFAPLGMNSTQIYDDHQRIVPGRAYSYRYSEDGLGKAVLSYANSGATSLFTTANDLAKWVENYRTAAVGGKDAIDLLQVQGVLNDGEVLDYALGISVSEQNGLRRISHSGGDAGYRTWLGYYPEIDAGVIVLGNIGSFGAGGIGVSTADAFFADHMDFGEPEESGEEGEQAQSEVSEELGNAVAGRYSIEGGPYVEIAFEGGQLTAQVEGQPVVPLSLIENSSFKIEVPGVEISVDFEVGADGIANTATLHQGVPIPMRRVEAWSPDASELSDYAGRYYSDELETFYLIKVVDDALEIRHVRHGSHSLGAEEKDVFTSDQWYIGSVNFERNDEGDVNALSMSNGRVRNLMFERTD